MSERPLRIALVAEGPTDHVVIQAALTHLLAERSFVLRQLQPESTPRTGSIEGGWSGVFHWCRQTIARSDNLADDILFQAYDLLIIHVDADVGDKQYTDAGITEWPVDLPCREPCPPATATTNRIRGVVLAWLNAAKSPDRLVLCTPSKATETWVLAALYPRDRLVRDGELECRDDPAALLVAKPARERLVVRKGNKLRKDLERYRAKADAISIAWPKVRSKCLEAERFSQELSDAIAVVADITGE